LIVRRCRASLSSFARRLRLLVIAVSRFKAALNFQSHFGASCLIIEHFHTRYRLRALIRNASLLQRLSRTAFQGFFPCCACYPLALGAIFLKAGISGSICWQGPGPLSRYSPSRARQGSLAGKQGKSAWKRRRHARHRAACKDRLVRLDTCNLPNYNWNGIQSL